MDNARSQTALSNVMNKLSIFAPVGLMLVLAFAGSTPAQRQSSKPPTPEVESVRVYPNVIRLGDTPVLVVRLRKPAPKSGAIVGIGQNSDGTAETLVDTPTAFTFQPGARKAEFVIRTKRVENPARRIVFCASTHSPINCTSGTQGAILILRP